MTGGAGAGAWTLHLLGSLRLIGPDGTDAVLGSKVAATLLGYVALRRNPVPRTTIHELLWPESDGDRQAQNYRRALSNLRQFFETHGTGLVLESSPTSIALIPDTVAVDVHTFRQAARIAMDQRLLPGLIAAADLYSGPLWQDGPEDWILAERQELEELFSQVVGEMTHQFAEAGEHKEAVRHARAAVVKAPLREDVHACLIRAYARAGMGSEALKQFEVLEAMLDEHWGESPSVMTLAALDTVPAPTVPGAAVVEAPPGWRQNHVRREADKILDAALAAGEGVIVIQGPRQVGKSTMLARALKAAVDRGDLTVLSDFQAHDAALLGDTEKFCRAVATLFVRQVGGDAAFRADWNDWLGPNANLDAAIQAALNSTDRRVVWAIDELDQLLGLQAGNDFLGLVRSWQNRRVLDPGGPWSRLTLLIAHTGETESLITDPRQSPFDVGVVIELEDFRREEVEEFNRSLGSPLTADELDATFDQTQGHPYLTKRILETAAKEGFESSTAVMRRLVTAATRSPTGLGRTGSRDRHNLIGLERPFVGRVKERQLLLNAVTEDRSRLVTLLGFGGMGKSTLASVVAWDCVDKFVDGVWWAECETCRNVEQALGAIATAIGEPMVELGPEPMAAAIGKRKLLLVMDCCEGLAGELAMLARLIRSCPHLHVLTTSRRTLDVPGERVIELTGLDVGSGRGALSDAEQLFVDAAVAADPDFEVDTRRKEVHRIVRRLEGIPLALILAASRLRHLSLDDVDERLERGQLATVRAPSGKGRHSSLHEIVASTLALVEPEDQKAAARVAVFQGGFRLADAQAVLGDSTEALDQLSRLRDSSLLQAEARSSGLWYRQLDSVREFLREATAIDELRPWREAHARHFASLALEVRASLEKSEDSAVAEILAASGGNLREGWVFSVETGDSHLIRDYAFGLARAYVEAGLLQDLATMAAPALDAAAKLGDDSLRFEVLGLLGIAARRSGHFDLAMQRWLERADAARDADNPTVEADALGDVIDLAIERGQVESARELLVRLDRVVPRSTDAEADVWAKLFEARCLLAEGRSLEALQVALEAQSRQKDPAHEAYVLRTVSGILRQAGDLEDSRRTAERLLIRALEGEQLHRAAVALIELVEVARAAGDFDRARKAVIALLALPRRYVPKVFVQARELASNLGIAKHPPLRVPVFLDLARSLIAPDDDGGATRP